VSQQDMKWQTAPPRLHFSLAPEPSRLLRARERIRDYLNLNGADQTAINDVVLAIEEAFTNAIRHSGSNEDIDVRLRFEGASLRAVVADKGRGFDVESFDDTHVPDPLLDHGRGLYLISKLCDELHLSCNGGVTVEMVKGEFATRSQPPEHSSAGLAAHDTDYWTRREQLLRDEMAEAFASLDWEYRFTYANKAAFELFAMSSEECLGTSIWDAFPATHDMAVGRAIRRAMELGVSSIEEYSSPTKGRWVECRIYPSSCGVSLYLRDIDDRKRKELERDNLFAALRESRIRLAATLAAITDGFYTLDRTWRVTYLNDKAAEVFPGGKEALGANFWELFPDDVGSAYETSKRRAMGQGEVCSFEFYYPPFDAWFEERDYPSAGGITVLFADISERKRVEKALRDAELKSADLIRYAPTGIYEIDIRGSRFRTVNDAMCAISGYTREELLAMNPTDLLDAESQAIFAERLGKALAGEPVSDSVDYRFKTKDRRLRDVVLNTTFTTDDGAIDGALVVGYDVTERKQVEEALRQSAEAARQAEERYRSLFNTLIEGFCVIEMVFDVDGRPVDYRFLEINEVFEEQTGLHEARGKLMRDLAPDHEQHWFDIYGKVALTGEATRFTAPAAALGRYYDVSAFRVAGPESRQVGILFNDISERHRVEEERQHLLEESQAQSEELQAQGEELRVQSEELQAHYDEQLKQRTALLRENELRAGLNVIGELLHSTLEPDEVVRRALGAATRALGIDAAAIELSEGGTWPMRYVEGLPAGATGSSLLAEPVIARLVAHSGEALVLGDVTAHKIVGPFAGRCGIRSLVAVPLVAREEVVGVLLLVERRTTRHFEPAEVDFARRLGASIGLALENARLFSDVRETGEHLGNVLESMADGFVSVDREWRYTLVNPQAERLIGQPAGELLGRSMEELFPDMSGWPHYRSAMEGRTAETFEIWSKPLETWLEVHAYPTADGLSILFSDITPRKAAAEELRLHNADLAERAHFADSLNAINRLLHATLDFDTIMQGALDEGAEALGATAGLIEMSEESQWVMRYQHGLAEADVGLRLSAAESPIATRVGARGEPLAISDAQADGVVGSRFLRTHALRSLLAVPLVARGAVIGCLTFYGATVRVFSDSEIDFARKLGATVSMALENARLYEEQQRIAQTLQENFIHELPTVAGLELGVVSRTANEPELVGGDFSDVFVADDTHVVVLIGDVAGKVVRAAGLTETVRSTVRALAVTDFSPASILAKANELLLRFDPEEPHVTAFLAVLDPHTGHLSYASAGHPAPVHLGALTCRTLDLTFGPPLGTFERPYADAHAMLTLEDYLVLYTDGVTEARRDGKMYGEAQLVTTVADLRGLSAQELAEALLQDIGSYADKLADDIQIVTLRLA
jgi:PAS domain S-box-containing protein